MDGLIPAQLLGNMWAQEWGNIYDIVAPTDPKLSQFKPVDLESALKQQIAAKDPAAAPAFASGTDLSSDAGHAAKLAAGRDMVRYGESFFKSLGFAPLPATFWQRRSLSIRAIAMSCAMHRRGTWMQLRTFA